MIMQNLDSRETQHSPLTLAIMYLYRQATTAWQAVRGWETMKISNSSFHWQNATVRTPDKRDPLMVETPPYRTENRQPDCWK
jgi:hypothetical protein